MLSLLLGIAHASDLQSILGSLAVLMANKIRNLGARAH
jgi:hypothetical protein